MKSTHSIQGMTLIELMIALAIVAIIAAIALPSYQAQIVSSNRNEAKTALVQLKLQQENYRLDNSSYASTTNFGNPTLDNYTVSFDNISSTTFTLKATAKVGNSQQNDTGCTELSIDQSMNTSPATCW
jgi:type IV pilus assembly protein PilE